MSHPKATIDGAARYVPDQPESILYACLPCNIVVIRVCGRGNHQNSLALRKVFDLTSNSEACPQYIIDLEKCSSMDSTFMGVVATLGLNQSRRTGCNTILLHMNSTVWEQLDLLGLHFILEMRDSAGDDSASRAARKAEFEPVEAPEVSKLERIVLMIEAHERLIDADSQNEVKFKGVIESLRDSLRRSRGNP